MKKEIYLIIATLAIVCVLYLSADKNWEWPGFFAAMSAECLAALIIALCGRNFGKFVSLFASCSIVVGTASTLWCFEDLPIPRLLVLWGLLCIFDIVTIGLLAAIEFLKNFEDGCKNGFSS